MDDLMARTMVENLSIGIDPITGKVLPETDACSNEIVQEAIKTVLEFCSIDSYATILERQRKEKRDAAEKRKEERKKLREERYSNQGKAWTEREDGILVQLYRIGYSIPHIANVLKRSPSAIKSRLRKLGMESQV